ncbi:hypothetical protein [Nonomuraea insulae]|uniref:ABC transporter domain-containing protein n=1 Tax=Nonomuraea insulae TaxID=1616787 RepID=A0ABW1DB82_9ACTN
MSVSKTHNRPDAPPVQEIREGEFFAQVGPSGRGKCCGKSTILNMVARLLSPNLKPMIVNTGDVIALDSLTLTA